MRRTLILTSNMIASRTIAEALMLKAAHMDREINTRRTSNYFNVLIDDYDMIEIDAIISPYNQRGRRADFLIMTQDYFNRMKIEECGILAGIVVFTGSDTDNIYIINPDEDNDWLYEKLFFTS